MKSFWILLVACWLSTDDVSCIGSNETTVEVSDNKLLKETPKGEMTTELTKQAQSRRYYKDDSLESGESCPCFQRNMKGRAPVFQNLDVNQFGVKRLVMYLYYSDATKQIEIHVPNQAKQKLIPDVYEDGDILETIKTPCLINSFKKYIDLIQSSDDDVSDYRDQLYPGNKRHEITYNKPDYVINDSSSSDSDSKSSDYASLESDESIEKHYNQNKPIPAFKEIILINGKPVSLNLVNNEKRKHSISHPKQPHISSYQAPAPKVIPVYNHLIDNAEKYMHYTPSDSWNLRNTILPYSVQSYTKNKGQDYPSNEPKPFGTLEWMRNKYPDVLWKYLHQPNRYKNKGNHIKQPSVHPKSDEWHNEYPYLPWADKKPKPSHHSNGGHYFMGDESPEQIKQHFWYNKYSGNDQSGPLDVWLQQQTKKLHKPSKSTDFEVNDIKFHLEQILLANDMSLSPYGYIVNGAGQTMDMDRFSLRPILIGGPIALRQVLNNKNNKLKVSNSPFLKAVLFTSSNPMRILGTIPLGEKYLPSGELTYSGEVNDDVHDYNVPSVPLYNLGGDYKINMKQKHSPKHITLGRSGDSDEQELLEELLKDLTTEFNVLKHNVNNVLQNTDSKENVEHSVSEANEHSNKSHYHHKSSNQTHDHYHQKPVITILNLNHSEAENANAHVGNGKSDISKDDRTEDSSSLRHGITFSAGWQGNYHPVGIHKRPYWTQKNGDQGTEFETSQMYDDLQLQIPGYRIIPGKLPRKRHYNVESHNHYTHKPISSEVYRPNVDSNDSLDLYPGFRIIGGHAATSSGAPLSNKGRSGHINDSVSNDHKS